MSIYFRNVRKLLKCDHRQKQKKKKKGKRPLNKILLLGKAYA